MKLFVANLPFKTTSDDLKEIFEECGEVQSAQVITDRNTGRSRGFGFVEMATEKDSQNAIQSLNDKDIEGRKLVVKKAESK